MAPPPAAAPAVQHDFAISWPLEPVVPAVPANPVAHAVQLLLKALWDSNGDRIVLETGKMPVLVTGNRQRALMNYRPSLQGVLEIATYLFPREYLDALEEIGGTCFRISGFKAIAAYDADNLTIEITRVRYSDPA